MTRRVCVETTHSDIKAFDPYNLIKLTDKVLYIMRILRQIYWMLESYTKTIEYSHDTMKRGAYILYASTQDLQD